MGAKNVAIDGAVSKVSSLQIRVISLCPPLSFVLGSLPLSFLRPRQPLLPPTPSQPSSSRTSMLSLHFYQGLARRQMRPGNCGHRRVFAIASPEHLHTPCRKNSTTHTSPGPTDSASSIAKATYILSASALTAYLSVNAERVASNGSARSQGPLENPGSSPFLIGVCGGTASGKTSVCKRIIELLKADRELVSDPRGYGAVPRSAPPPSGVPPCCSVRPLLVRSAFRPKVLPLHRIRIIKPDRV